MKNNNRDPFTNFTQELRKEVVDINTGELLGSSSEKVGVVPKEPNYVKVYLADIAHLNDLPNWVTGILYELLKRMDYSGMIILNGYVKDQIGKELKITNLNTIDQALTKFVKKEILLRKGQGAYLANPWLFGKGEWQDIRAIRLQVNYNLDGSRDLKAKIEKAPSHGSLQDIA